MKPDQVVTPPTEPSQIPVAEAPSLLTPSQVAQPVLPQALTLEAEPVTEVSEPVTVSRAERFPLLRYNKLAFLIVGALLLIVTLIGVGSLLLATRHNARLNLNSAQKGTNYAVGSNLQLNGVRSNGQLDLGEANQLTVNGQLQLSNTLVIEPTAQPSAPKTGQIYYNQAANAPYYYNGTEFINLAPQHVLSIGGGDGAITLGDSLTMVNNQLSVSDTLLQQIGATGGSSVSSLQGQTGDVTLAAGPGIGINGTTISNSGVISLAAGSANLLVTSDGNGHYTVTDTGGGGSVSSISGTANQVIASSSTGNVTLSLPQDIAILSSPNFAGLTLGNPGSTTGSLNLANSSSGREVILQGVDPSGSGNATIQIPSIAGGSTDTVCLVTLGNCAGTGGGIIGSGTSGHITKFSASHTITDSNLTEAGSTLTYGGNLVVNAGVGFTGSLVNLEVNGSSKLTVDQNGSSVQAGTLTVNGTGASSVAGSLSVATGLTVTTGGLAVTGNSTIAGTLASLTGLTSSGAITFSSLNSAGVVHTNGSGLLSTSNVVLGTDTSGNYVANLGSLTGLTTGGNSGSGSTPTLSVNYGSIANTSVQGNVAVTVAAGTGLNGGGTITLGAGGTATLNVQYGSIANTSVQGNTTLTCASGSGNLAGGGNSVTLGAGGSCNNITITNSPIFSGTLAVQGAGGVTVGIAGTTTGIINFANVANSNLGTLKIVSLGQATTYNLPDPGQASADICLSTGNCAGTGGGIVGSGTAGHIAKFTGGGTIADSTLTESGTTLTASGNVVIQGANSLTLGTASGNTGSILFKNATNGNTVTLQAGVSGSDFTLTLPTTKGNNGDCLQSNGAGALSFQACTGGPGGGVTTLDSLFGVLTLNNSSGSGSAITIDDASTSQKGIAQFNATNFTVSGGIANTIQNIATGSSPTFGGLTLSSALTVANGGTGANSLTLNGILYGNGTSAVQITSAAANSVLATNGSNVPSLTQTLPMAVQGNITNTGALTSGSIASGFSSISTGNLISTSATLHGGTLTVGSSNQFQVDGSGNATTTGTLAVQGSGGITVGIAGSTPGVLNLANGTNSNLSVLQSAAPSGTGNATYILPTIAGGASDTVCLVLAGNCAGSGTGIVGTGTAGHLAKFTAGNTIADTNLTESGSALTYAGNVVVNAGSGFTGNLVNLEVNSSSKLSVDQNGNTIQAGTLTVNGTGGSSVAGTLTAGTGLTVTTGGAAITGNSTIVGDLAIQSANLTTNQTTFNLLNTTATTLNIGGAVGSGGINLAGGSLSTGCTIDGSTGNLACSGNITGSGGTVGYWSRSGTILQPATGGDSITTSGNISTSGSGTITATGILNANATGQSAITIADSGAQNSGITFGGDTVLYRSAASTLSTGSNDGLIVNGNFTGNGQQNVLQPSSSLTSGQTNLAQTLTNASSSGGTVNAFSQTLTVSNTTSSSTTNGLKIALADNASSLGNVDNGISISLTGTNTTRAELGVGATVTRGIALQGLSSGSVGNSSVQCNGVSIGLGLCAGDTNSSNSGAGIYAFTGSRGTVNIYDPQGSGVYGLSQQSGTAAAFYGGVKGLSLQTTAAAYTSMGVYGQATGGAGASVYGGYFTLGTSSTATAGSALYASNSTTTENILQLQDNTTDVFTVANGGDVTTKDTSTSAFQIQNAAGTSLLTADTANTKINLVGDLNVGTRFGNRLFSDDFESGGFGLWDGGVTGSATVDTATVHDGKYAAKINPSTGVAYVDATVASNTTVYARAWINVTSQTSSSANLLSLLNATNGGSDWDVFRSGGNLEFWNNCTSVATNSGAAFSSSAWHLVEMRITTGAGSGISQVWLDGTQVVNLSSQNNCTNPINEVQIGDNAGGRTFTAFIDDLSVDTATNGTASSLNVDDSFHVGGTSTFGNRVLIGGSTSANSTSAFQVQNASGVTALNVDTTNLQTTLRGGTDTATLGSELFTSGFTGTGWGSISGTGPSATATHVSGTTALSPTSSVSPTSGQGYMVQWTVNNPNSGGTLVVTMGGQTLASYTFDANNGYPFTDSALITASSSANLAFTPNGAFTGTVTGVSVKRVTAYNNATLVVNNTSGIASLEVRASSNQTNQFIGVTSGSANTTNGTGNLAVGSYSLQYNVDGDANIGLGYAALQHNSSGNNNVGIGYSALNSNTAGTDNIAIGANTLLSNTLGFSNISLGTNALQANVSGYENIALGNATLFSNTTGTYNFGAGDLSLKQNTTGSNNVGIGYSSLRDNVTGTNNNALGSYALEHTTGNENSAFGLQTLATNIGGNQNAGFGNAALFSNSSGNDNAAVGYLALATNTTGSGNGALGAGADVIYGGLQNATAVGGNSQVGGNNNIILGFSSANGVNSKVGIGTSYAPNSLTVNPNTYQTGTITQGGGSGSVVGSGTTFTSSMVGGTIFYSDGTTGTITAFTDGTHITSSNTTGGWSGASYAIVWAGFNVKGDASVLLQPTSDSTTAFQVQNAAGTTTLLNADTTNLTVTVAGNTTTFASLTLTNAHFKSTQTTKPTIGTPTACGTSPTATVANSSTDSAGSFTLTSGSTTTTATCQVVITFNKPYGGGVTAPKSVILTGASTNASKMTAAVTATSATTFTVVLPQTDAVSTAYQFYYWVIE